MRVGLQGYFGFNPGMLAVMLNGRKKLVWFLGLALTLMVATGCKITIHGYQAPARDSGVPDGSRRDIPVDGPAADHAVVDRELPDAPTPDLRPDLGLDLAVPDLPLPDLPLPDVALPDLPVPDVAVPDLPVPDLPVPDLPVPDMMVPDLPVPDMMVPDLPVPDLPVPDMLVPDITVPDLPVPDHGTIAGVWISIGNGPKTTHGHATIKPGGAVSLAGVVSCPVVFGCHYSWDLGNGTKSTAQSPGSVVYNTVGLHHLTFTVMDKHNTVLGTARADVAVWTGKYIDKFARTTIEWDKYLWFKPLDSAALFSIKSGMLHVKHDLGLPGSGAIRLAPLVHNLHLEVTIRRSPVTTVIHYSDVILRMHPQKLNGAFYRVRVKEGVALYGHEVDLTIFKIVDPANEHGINLTPKPAILHNYDPARKKNMRIKINLRDDKSGVPVFDVYLAEAANPNKILLQMLNIKDTTTAPHTHAGFTGLTQYTGETYFDDYVVQEL